MDGYTLFDHFAADKLLHKERQQKELHYRRARMVLAGLGLLDVRRLVEFREAPLKSLEGKVQGQ